MNLNRQGVQERRLGPYQGKRVLLKGLYFPIQELSPMLCFFTYTIHFKRIEW